MKKIDYKLATYLLTSIILFFGGCKEELPSFDKNNSYLEFTTNFLITDENDPTTQNIIVGASSSAEQDISATFSFVKPDSLGNNKYAQEGLDFVVLNQTKTLSFKKGVGYDTIKIKTIDNPEKDRHRIFKVTLSAPETDYAIGFNGENTFSLVTILDDESKSKYEGRWKVEGKLAFYASEGGQIKVTADTAATNTFPFAPYEVRIELHPTELNTYLVHNFGGIPELTATMTINEATKEMSLLSGSCGFIKGNEIFLVGFDENGEDTGTEPIVGKLVQMTN